MNARPSLPLVLLSSLSLAVVNLATAASSPGATAPAAHDASPVTAAPATLPTKNGVAPASSPAAKTAATPSTPVALAKPTVGWRFEELRRFPAPEAGQAALADAEFVYAVNNHTLAKYRKTGERVAQWEGGKDGPIIHLNAAVIFDGKLYAAHSNYPGVPMVSSVEIFDCATLQHVGSHSFGRTDGSLTWLERRDGRWLACFVHYGNRGGEPGRGPEWTQIVEFDDAWQRRRGWVFPADLVAHLGGRGYSVSGGAFGPGGLLYVSGHDETALFVLDFPEAGSVLRWVATVPMTAEGQAFGWDPSEPGVFYAIGRKTREVIVGRISPPAR